MESGTNEISNLCRTCRNESKNMYSLFETITKMEPNIRIDEMLMACTSIKICIGDGLPSRICFPCTDLLRASYLFKKKCEDSDNDFKQYIKNETIADNYDEENSESNRHANPLSIQHTLLSELSNVIIENAPESPTTPLHHHHPPSAVKCEISLENKDFVEILDKSQILLTCRACYKNFSTFDGLRSHKRLHSGDLFECKVCTKTFTRLNHLQRHESTHRRRKVHVCKICNKTLTRYEHLKRHLITHVKEKPFACTRCNRGFSRAEHLLNHAARCKGDRVHVCDVCNKGFNRADSLEVHKKLHDNKQPNLPTLEDLDNVEEYYFEIDYDDDSMLNDYSDNEEDDDDKGVCFEPQINITENSDQQVDFAIDDSIKISNNKREDLDDSNCSEENFDDLDYLENVQGKTDASVKLEGDNEETADFSEEVKEEVEQEEQFNSSSKKSNSNIKKRQKDDPDFIAADEEEETIEDSDCSTDSEYRPIKTTSRRNRGKRGRPRKYPKKSGRPRGRPAGSGKIKPFVNEDGSREYRCTRCEKKFSTSISLEKHMLRHDGVKTHSCNECGKIFIRMANLKRHLMSHSGLKPHQCDKCTKKFSRRDHLFAHMKLHMRKNKFQCDICQCPFTRATLLAKHQIAKHNVGVMVLAEKKYKCEICQKGFTTEKYRDVHMKSHFDVNSFVCKTCQKPFISKSHLTEHMKFHNEHSKKFLCSECGQRFIRNDYLVIHMRRHKGEKPFKCRFCGKGFPRTTDLTVHERYHTGEKTHLCTICGRGFGRAYNLTVHMRTHTGEKPYRCTYCDAAFAQGNDLKAHIRRHTGERFHCDMCTESFLMGYLLTQHKRNVHGLNVVSNIRRLKPVNKMVKSEDGTKVEGEEEPVTIKLPPPVVSVNVLNAQLAHLAAATTVHLQNEIGENCQLKFETT